MGIILNAIRAALFASLFMTKLGQGLNIAPDDLRYLQGRWALMLRSLLTVIILMPIAALIIILLVKPSPRMTVALVILAASPAAPLVTTSVRRAGGHSAYSSSLQLSLALISIATVPLILEMMGSVLGFRVKINPFQIAEQVATAQFLPIGLGVIIASKFRRLEKIGRILAGVSGFILAAVGLLIVAVMYKVFLIESIRSYIAIILIISASFALGHLSAPRVCEMQKVLAIETATRNPGLAMFIAALNFPKAKPLPLLIPYIVILVLISTIYMSLQARRSD